MQYLEKKATLFSVNISDIRGKKKSCEICNKDFTMLIKEHQCKRCKRAVCFQCAQTKAPVYRLKKYSETTHRQCTKCKAESERLIKFVKDKKLVFGKDTVSAQWLQYLNNKMSYPDITSEYFEYLNDPQFELKFKTGGLQEEQAYKEFKTTETNMERIYSELQDTFNYSLQEFMFFVIDKTDPQTVIISISNVVKAFLCKHVIQLFWHLQTEFGFSQELLLIVIFVLCFASEPIAFMIICKFYENIYPKQFYPLSIKKNGFQSQRHMKLVLQLLQSVYQVPQGDAQNIWTYLEKDFMRVSSQMSINTMTFENTFYLLDRTIKAGAFVEFIKGLTVVCFMKMEEIKRYLHNIEKLEVIILRNVDLNKFQERLGDFDRADIKCQEQVNTWIHEEEEKGGVIDEKTMTTKIVQSEQYLQAVQYLKEEQEEKKVLEAQLAKSEEAQLKLQGDVAELRRTNQKQAQQNHTLQEENFALKMMVEEAQKNTTTNQEDPHSEFVKKRMALMQAQIEEISEKLKLRTAELEALDSQKAEIKSTMATLQEEKRASDKRAEEMQFEVHTLQYEADMSNGRNRNRGRESLAEEPPKKELNAALLQEQITKLSAKLDTAERKYDKLVDETSEAMLTQIRMQRLLTEAQYESKTAAIQVQVQEEQLKKEKDNLQNMINSYEDRLSRQYKKTFESLQVVHDLNDELRAENEKYKKLSAQLEQTVVQDGHVRQILQEENQKLKAEKEELHKMANLANQNDDNEDVFAEFNHLQDDEDQNRARQMKAFFVRVRALQQEIRFKNIDLLIKKEYLVSMQKKLRVQIQEIAQLKKMIECEVPIDAEPIRQMKKQPSTPAEPTRKQFTVKEAITSQQSPSAAPKDKDCSIF